MSCCYVHAMLQEPGTSKVSILGYGLKKLRLQPCQPARRCRRNVEGELGEPGREGCTATGGATNGAAGGAAAAVGIVSDALQTLRTGTTQRQSMAVAEPENHLIDLSWKRLSAAALAIALGRGILLVHRPVSSNIGGTAAASKSPRKRMYSLLLLSQWQPA